MTEEDAMTDRTGCIAADRACLRMSGADARTVLQGVVTNDVERLGTGAVYAALLTPQGKYLFDFFLVGEPDGGVLIDVAAMRAEALAKRLKMYCLRRDARVEPAADIGVALVWGGDGAPEPGGTLIVADPREPGLGWRLYAPDPAAALASLGTAEATADDLAALRVALGVPETGVELIPEETFPLEAGFERLNGVDFRKGCYVGQEVTARMKHKSVMKKGLARVRIEGQAPPGTPVTTPEGKPAGTLFTQSGGRGLAHLRLDRADGTLTAGGAALTLDARLV